MEINGKECCKRNYPQVKRYNSLLLLKRLYEIEDNNKQFLRFKKWVEVSHVRGFFPLDFSKNATMEPLCQTPRVSMVFGIQLQR